MRSQELLISRQFCKPLTNFVKKKHSSRIHNGTSNGGLQGTFDFFDFAAYKIDSLTFLLNLDFYDFPG